MKLRAVLMFVTTLTAFCGFAGERVPWTTSRVIGSPEKPYDFRLERRFSGIAFTNPVDIAYSRESRRWFVGEQGGRVFTFDERGERLSLAGDFGPVQGKEGALYALTFDPAFEETKFIYVCYALKAELPDGSRVSRFKVTDDPEPKIDFASEEILITWLSGGHNGCCLKFGKDGYLYISTGDAAGPNPPDPLKTGQDVTDLMSSILRIDVHRKEGGRNYRVPTDNPFVGHETARPEIWAYGFRNPWRMGFDAKTGELWVGDVGWELWELVYKVQRGGNYGWSILEGRQPVLPNDPKGPTPILPPTKEHPHNEAASVTGGLVYYGKKFPALTGAFIYGDWETGKIWGIRADGQKITYSEELTDSTTRIIAFAEDTNGEAFVLDYNGGIYELMENTTPHSPADFPRRLSETGLFSSVKDLKLAAGVYPFQVNAPMWNDYGVADRLVALPGTSSIDTREALWRFPSNAVLARTISLEMERGKADSSKRIETQLLHHTGDGWGAYSYRWNAEQSDAELVPTEGADELLKVKDSAVPGGVRLQPWRFSSRAECLRCHNTWCGTALGFQPEQLGAKMNELEELKVIASKPKEVNKQLVSPYDSNQDLNARARSYLHINCSHCHRDNAGGSVPSVLNFELPLDKMRSVNARAVLGDLGLVDGKVITPGKPFSSVLLFRTSATGRTRMPYIGTELVDDEGAALLREWIASLDGKSNNESVAKVAKEISSVGVGTVAKLTANSSTALLLAHALAEQSVPLAVKERMATEARKSSNPLIAELFERFLPAEARANVLQPTARREEVLALSGDTKRGAALLNDSARTSCLQCHQYGKAGRVFGPSFASIKKPKEEILHSILEPSREVAPEYVLYTVETGDDEVLSGMIVKRGRDEIVVRDATGTDHTLPAAKVTARPQQLSAMPEGLLAGLSAQEVADLIEAIIAEAKE